MRKFLLAIVLLTVFSPLLCSCRRGPHYTETTEPETVTETEAVTADAGLILSAAGFTVIHDGSLGADRVIPDAGTDGLYAYLLVYDEKKISLRVALEGGGSVEYGGKSYEISNGDMLADDALIFVIRGIADGKEAAVNGRAVTDAERETLGNTVRLYDAAYGAPYIIDRKEGSTLPVNTDGNGDRVYECEKYLIRFPSSFEASLKDGTLTLTASAGRMRTVSVTYAETPFNVNLGDAEAAGITVRNTGGTMTSPPAETHVGGKRAYRLSYEKDGVYLIQYFIDGGEGTYILTGGSYEKNDDIPKNIISTFTVR